MDSSSSILTIFFFHVVFLEMKGIVKVSRFQVIASDTHGICLFSSYLISKKFPSRTRVSAYGEAAAAIMKIKNSPDLHLLSRKGPDIVHAWTDKVVKDLASDLHVALKPEAY
jgi:hypothetical protein